VKHDWISDLLMIVFALIALMAVHLVALHQRAGIARVGLEVQHAAGVGVQHRIVFDLIIGRETDHGFGAVVAHDAALETERMNRWRSGRGH
jgi:hypothetical protein